MFSSNRTLKRGWILPNSSTTVCNYRGPIPQASFSIAWRLATLLLSSLQMYMCFTHCWLLLMLQPLHSNPNDQMTIALQTINLSDATRVDNSDLLTQAISVNELHSTFDFQGQVRYLVMPTFCYSICFIRWEILFEIWESQMLVWMDSVSTSAIAPFRKYLSFLDDQHLYLDCLF